MLLFIWFLRNDQSSEFCWHTWQVSLLGGGKPWRPPESRVDIWLCCPVLRWLEAQWLGRWLFYLVLSSGNPKGSWLFRPSICHIKNVKHQYQSSAKCIDLKNSYWYKRDREFCKLHFYKGSNMNWNFCEKKSFTVLTVWCIWKCLKIKIPFWLYCWYFEPTDYKSFLHVYSFYISR